MARLTTTATTTTTALALLALPLLALSQTTSPPSSTAPPASPAPSPTTPATFTLAPILACSTTTTVLGLNTLITDFDEFWSPLAHLATKYPDITPAAEVYTSFGEDGFIYYGEVNTDLLKDPEASGLDELLTTKTEVREVTCTGKPPPKETKTATTEVPANGTISQTGGPPAETSGTTDDSSSANPNFNSFAILGSSSLVAMVMGAVAVML